MGVTHCIVEMGYYHNDVLSLRTGEFTRMPFMPRLYTRLLIAWFLLVLLSGVGFYYLAYHPRMMLVVEDFHPSFAYERGRQLLQQAKYNDAIATFRRGVAYFKQLFDETGQESHRRQYAQGLLELANAFCRMGDPASLAQAVELFTQATRLEPDASEGQPYLAQGEALERLKRFEEALMPFTVAVEKGTVLISLLARFGRGQCQLALGRPAEACEDWYYFSRYFDQITPVHWNSIQTLPPDACPWSPYIVGRARMALEQNSEARMDALRFLQDAWQNHPENRSVRYYHAFAAGTPGGSDAGALALDEFYPPGGESSRALGTAVIDLFREKEGPCVARLELSGAVEGKSPPVLKILQNRRETAEIQVLGSQPRLYSIRMQLQQGVNLVLLRASPLTSGNGRPSILLHSFLIEAETGEEQ